MRGKPVIQAVALAAAVVVAGCAPSSPRAASVDGHSISQESLNDELRAIGANERFIASVESQEAVRTAGGAFEPTFVSSLLGRRIWYEVIDDEVSKRKLKITADDRRTARTEMVDVAGGEEIFNAFPKEYQDTLIERAAKTDALAVSLSGRPRSDEAARAYYDAHKDEFTRACVSHILVGSRDREKAEALKARITGGEDFAAVARAESLDVQSKPTGGDLGCNINRETIAVPAFVDAVMTQPINEVGGPVETNFGLHLIKVRSREVPPYDQVADQARQKVVDASKAKLQEWIIATLAKADITVDPRYGTYDKQRLTVVPPPPTTSTLPSFGGSPTTQPSKS